MNRLKAIEAAEKENFTFAFADYWVDVYLDTRGDEATIPKFIKFLEVKKSEKS